MDPISRMSYVSFDGTWDRQILELSCAAFRFRLATSRSQRRSSHRLVTFKAASGSPIQFFDNEELTRRADPVGLSARLLKMWPTVEAGRIAGRLLEIGVVYGGEGGQDGQDFPMSGSRPTGTPKIYAAVRNSRFFNAGASGPSAEKRSERLSNLRCLPGSN
jgi:hypothetical protein